ncbi:uncharacterized protein LOC128342727 [Hemicordylus capensis]|uniref:uncharacterized protein LOC128342727 n=1 Tax=Hemicordylus capensis TaxID=884348 RepID=UPI0023022AC1|nr:uncharacterized protein LOC128342727 [Hemicordylus capensis]
MPGKAKGKKGGKPVKPPKRPAPPPSSDEEDDQEMVLIRGLVQRMEALEKARAIPPPDKDAGPSGVPKPAPKRTRVAVRTQLLKSISDRLAALEHGAVPGGPAAPAPTATLPGVPDPVVPVPVPDVLEPAAPIDPAPAAPAGPSPEGPPAPLVPGSGGAAAPVRILICGHSLVFWAFKRASTSQWGTQLGLAGRAIVCWKGMRGMLWSQLLPAVWDYVGRSPRPDVLVIHLGENDLGKRTGVSLVQQASSDMQVLRAWLPGAHIVWAEWLQRRAWRGVQNLRGIERARRKASAAIGKLVVADGGSVLHQPGLLARFPHLFRPDGVHLSEEGCDIYIRNLRNRLAELLELGGAGRSS